MFVQFFSAWPQVCKCTKPQTHSSVCKGQSTRFNTGRQTNIWYISTISLLGLEKTNKENTISFQGKIETKLTNLTCVHMEITFECHIGLKQNQKNLELTHWKIELTQNPAVTELTQGILHLRIYSEKRQLKQNYTVSIFLLLLCVFGVFSDLQKCLCILTNKCAWTNCSRQRCMGKLFWMYRWEISSLQYLCTKLFTLDISWQNKH